MHEFMQQMSKSIDIFRTKILVGKRVNFRIHFSRPMHLGVDSTFIFDIHVHVTSELYLSLFIYLNSHSVLCFYFNNNRS